MPSVEAFAPPTKDEIEAECLKYGYAVDPVKFLTTYQAQGWKLGNGNQMTDWKATLRKWHIDRKDKKGFKGSGVRDKPKTGFINFQQHAYDMQELERRAKM